MKVTSADVIAQYASVADFASLEPVTITENGRDRLVLMAVEEYERLKRGGGQAVALADRLDDTSLDDDSIEWNR